MKISDKKLREILGMIGNIVEVHHIGGEHHGQLVYAGDQGLHLYVHAPEATNEEKPLVIPLKDVTSVVFLRHEASSERRMPTLAAVA